MSEKPYYETMYILRPDIPEEEVDSHLKKYSEMLVESGVEVLDSQMRGKRRLAYPISKHKEGIYVQLSHKGDGEHIAIFEKSMRLSEDIIRYLTVKQDGPLPTKKASKGNEKDEKAKEENVEEKKEIENKEKVETNKEKEVIKEEEAKDASKKTSEEEKE